MLGGFEQVIKWPPHSGLFVDGSGGCPRKAPNVGNVDVAVLRIAKCAQGDIFFSPSVK